MNLINLNLIIKSLRRFKGIGILNMSGLALGLAVVILISTWISHELSYDSWQDNADRIFRVESKINFTGDPFVWTTSPGLVASGLENDFPEVEATVRLQSGYQDGLKIKEKIYQAENLYYTENEFFDIFTYDLISSSDDNILDIPGSLIISDRIAKKIFGESDPLGCPVVLNDKDELIIRGVISNSPTNTHLQIDYLISYSLYERAHERDINSWSTYNSKTYIQLTSGAIPQDFNRKLGSYLQSKNPESRGVLFINPLTRIYLFRDPGFTDFIYPSESKGPISRVYLFGVIGLVIFLIACINYINLSTAVASDRAKEIGIRKVNGAPRSTLLFQLFGESITQTLLAMLVGLVIAVLVIPGFQKLSGKVFNIDALFSLKNVVIYIIVTTITGILAGLYPALLLSSYKPVKVLKSNPEDFTHGTGMRKVLVVVQFLLSIIFIFYLLVMSSQLRYMQGQDMGFNKERIVVIYPKTDVSRIDMLAERIGSVPGVSDVALGSNVPVRMGNWRTFKKWDGNTSEKALKFYMMQVDDRYFDLLGFNLLEGRNFREGVIANEVLINEAAIKAMDINDPIGKTVWWNDNQPYKIIGVVEDFHFHSLSEEIQPAMMYKSNEWWGKRIFVKIEPGNHFNMIDDIVKLVTESAPGFPVTYLFLDEEINRYYDDERRQNTLITLATLLSIIISSIGLFSLTAFTLRKKHKEIGIRKAHGATASKLLLKINREFGLLLIISSLIGLPLGFIISTRWLQSYAFHIEISLFHILLTILIILLISVGTITYHTLKAANLNPADTLRDE